MAENFGRVVKSLKGRDAGSLLAVIKTAENRLLVCDGKHRPLERPKSKNTAHLEFTGYILDADSMTTNRKIRRALRGINEEVQ